MMLTEKQKFQLFGKPGDQRNLITVKMPYPRRIAFMPNLPTTERMMCHKLVANKFIKIHQEILAHYGLKEIQRLNIDMWDGCFNLRRMRGGKEWSSHAWAIAEDLDRKHNGLRTRWANAGFNKPIYKPLLDIYYANGFVNQGKEKGFDAMHFEIFKL